MTGMTSLVQVLEEARDRVAAGWVQGRFSEDVEGQWCFCAIGAVIDVVREHDSLLDFYEIGRQALTSALPPGGWLDARFPGKPEVEVYNDVEGRTQEEVVALFDRAIEMVAA